jgi:NADH:ubiquinone oxidoreductase subunit 5 (subunit L)/multisubunit Na+/H+ antiporter MnhA subunit
MLTLVYVFSIPLFILNNTTYIENGVCKVKHPPISVYLPATILMVNSFYLVMIFLEPLLRSKDVLRVKANNKKRELVKKMFLTTSVSVLSTLFFHLSMLTDLGSLAPLFSSWDLTINYAMCCLPYLILKKGEGSTPSQSKNSTSNAV